MPRLRTLRAIVACLAMLAGAMNVASAAQAGWASAHAAAVGMPCSDCDDCDKAPCPVPMADCVQMHAGSGPAVVAGPVELATGAFVVVRWSALHRALSGLSPPPDPLPPRA